MKKILLTILALILVMSLAAGCGNSNTGNANGAGNAAVTEEEGDSSDDEMAKGLDTAFGVGFNIGNITLENLNMLNESDPEESQRAGAALDKDTMKTAAGNQEEE